MHKIIETANAPAPIGPYNQATQAGNTLYVSGQIALIPGSGELVDGEIENETHQVMKNLGAILAEAGGTSRRYASPRRHLRAGGRQIRCAPPRSSGYLRRCVHVR